MTRHRPRAVPIRGPGPDPRLRNGIPARVGRSERLVDLTRDVGAATYLCGTGGSRYLDQAPFAALGLAVAMFTPPEHPADLSPENARRVSVLADLAAAGPERLSTAMREHARLFREVGTWHFGRSPDQRLETAGLRRLDPLGPTHPR